MGARFAADRKMAGTNEATSLTILAMPKPFRGHIGIIQRNAIKSWTLLRPRPEIILFGHEEGAEECARELDLVHIAVVERNQRGTPLLADIFARAETHSNSALFAYVNADIILPAEITIGIEKVQKEFPKFLAVGRRTNLDVREAMDFSGGWEGKLKERMRREGHLESHTGIDFFAFPRGTYVDVPPLVIGRVWFDQWCIKYARKKGLPVVDMTKFAGIAHQVHDYNHVAGGRDGGVYGGAEAEENLKYYGERPHTYTILSSTHVMGADGTIARKFWQKELADAKNLLWNIFVHRTAGVRKKLGLSRSGRG